MPFTTSSHAPSVSYLPACFDSAQAKITKAPKMLGEAFLGVINTAISSTGWNDLEGPGTAVLPETSLELAPEQVTDLLALVAAPMALAGISLGGAPMTAMAMVVTAPLAALYFYAPTPGQSRDSQPALVIDVLSRLLPELGGGELKSLASKLEPHKDDLDLATVVRNTREALNHPARTAAETIAHLSVKHWARAARENKTRAFDAMAVGRPTPLAAAISDVLTALYASSPTTKARMPAAAVDVTQSHEARLTAYGQAVATDHALATSRQLQSWPSRHYQGELARQLRQPPPDRQDPAYRDLSREDKALLRYEHASRTLLAQMRLATLAAEDTPGQAKNIRLAYESKLYNAQVKRDASHDPAGAIRRHKLHQIPSSNSGAFALTKAPTTGHAGALTDLGLASPSSRTITSIFPLAASAAMRPSSASPLRASEKATNVALLSGRDYLLGRNQRALENAFPGWMLAEPADQRKTRASLLNYKQSLPDLVKLEKDVAKIPYVVLRYFNSRIRARFGIDIDSRNMTLRSRTWTTRKNWEMAGAQPVPVTYFNPPQNKTIDQSIWEAANTNFYRDEILPEFLRGNSSAQHVSVERGPNDEIVESPSIREWIEFIRTEDLGDIAQGLLNDVMKQARANLIRSYPAALGASLDTAQMGGFPAEPAALLRRVLDNPYSLPVTASGRQWQVSPLCLLEAETQAFVFHTEVLRSTTHDTHTDGGVLYIPNLCLRAFSSAAGLGDLIQEIIADPTSLEFLVERVPLDVSIQFTRAAKAAAQSSDIRSLKIELGKSLPHGLWDGMYQREVAFRKRNLETLIKPTAKVDQKTSIEQRMKLYGAAMGLLGSFTGLPLVGPIFMGANLAMLANTADDYIELRKKEGAGVANEMLLDLLSGILSVVDFDADDARSAAGELRPPVRTGSQLPAYFKTSDTTLTSVPPPDSKGIIRVNERTYARMDSDDLVEVNTSDPGHIRAIARWQNIKVSGPEITRRPDGRWSPRPEGVDNLTPVELFKQMLPEGPASWSDNYAQGLIDDLGLDHNVLQAIWDGQSPPSLLAEHMSRYQHLVDLDALPDVLLSDSSPVPRDMQPVIAQALADRTGRPLEIYSLDHPGNTPLLTARYAPHAPSAPSPSPVQVVERDGVEYFPLGSHPPSSQAVPNRLSLIDSVIEEVPGFGVNPSLWRSTWKGVRRGQVVNEVIDHIRAERATFQRLCLENISTPPASLDAPSARQSQVLGLFPDIPLDLVQKVAAALDETGQAGGPIDMGGAGRIVMDHFAQARRNDLLFRLKHGPHTTDSEAAYLQLLVNDPHWPQALAIEVIPSLVGNDGSLYRDTNQAAREYGEVSFEGRRLQLYHRDDGTYAPIVSSGSDSGNVHRLAGHAPDDLGSAILLAMEPADHAAWTSDSARVDVNERIAVRARSLDHAALDYKTGHETGALTAAALVDIVPASISLANRAARQDGTYEVDGKIYLYAYGHAYRLKSEDQQSGGSAQRHRVVSAGSPEDLSASATYAGLDHAPLVVRDDHGAWKMDTTDRLWTFHKLGTITHGIDVNEARAVLDVTDVSTQELRDIQLGKKGPSSDLGDAIVRARMRSVIGRLQGDASHFNDLQDPKPLLDLLTKLDGWPGDTSLEVSDEDGQVSIYGQPGTTKAIRIGLDGLQPPLLESLRHLLGTAFLGTVTGETSPPSLLARLGEKLSRLAASYPNTLFDAWYLDWQAPDSMLVQELMRKEPGLTKLASEEILAKEDLKRKADLLPGGKLTDDVRALAQAATTTTRIHRLKEALRAGRIATLSEKTFLIDVLNRLPGWEAHLTVHADGDILLQSIDGDRRIRLDGERYQAIDTDGRVMGTAQDVYAAMSLVLDTATYAKLGLAQTDNALRSAAWKQANHDKDIFRRHVQATDKTSDTGRVLCRVRKMVGGAGCEGAAATVPPAAQSAKDVVEAAHALVEKFLDKNPPKNPRLSTSSGNSAASTSSASSVRSQTLGTSNFASLVIERPIKARTSRETVKFLAAEETKLATGTAAILSRSSSVKESPRYFVSSSLYRDVDLPKLQASRSIVDQMSVHRDGVTVPGRHFKYKVRLSGGDKLSLDRPSDTEAALLEHVFSQIQAYTARVPIASHADLVGKLTVYTELAPCDSCQNIIRQFRSEFPNIEMDVYFSFKNSRERNSVSLADAEVHLWTPGT